MESGERVDYPRAYAPTGRERLTLRLLIFTGFICLVLFIVWFFSSVEPGNHWLYWPFTIALLFKLLKMIHEWYHYVDLSVPTMPESKKTWKVDMLTTACPGEPYEMFEETLRAMVAVKYPHTSYLCDEGNDPKLKALCDDLGVVHVTRIEKTNAKAGNINNALKQATGELCVVMDPDHVPHPDFLDRVVNYFEDPKIGYVQIVQGYGNQDESLIARGAAEQTYHFYGPMMMCMNSYGTVQAIGANCTFRRKALDDIGGHAPGLAEDMHTAMQIHAKGWKSLYVPEMLTRGLVPSTLPAYYKQQLKWSRGTFELLFVTFPKLCKNFTWRQNLHYFMLPLYYLFGLINLFDIIIPCASLVLADVAWKLELDQFFMVFSLLVCLSLLIRLYAQRWVMEESERGLHLMGGLLRFGTWYIFIIGFIYSIFRVNVPYIPTPKHDEPVNNWKLTLPNFIAAILILICIGYGLSVDYTPYSIAMAGFALINASILLFTVAIGQEKFLLQVRNKAKTIKAAWKSYSFAQSIYSGVAGFVCNTARNGALLFAFVLIFFFGTALVTKDQTLILSSLAPPEIKETGGFYTGIYIPEMEHDPSFTHVSDAQKKLGSEFDIVSLYQAWGPKSISEFPMDLLTQIDKHKGIPMITWEPWASTFPEFANHPDLKNERKICKAIYEGKFDNYLHSYAQVIRSYSKPVFLRFGHEPDNPAYPWSRSGGNTPGEYVQAWRHIVDLFQNDGVYNVSWVFNPWSESSVFEYFPGGRYVDWVSLTSLNYGYASPDRKWYSFDDIYLPFRHKIMKLKRPVMLAEFGSTNYGGDRSKWLEDAFGKIKNKYTEIKAVVLFNSSKDKNWPTAWRPDSTTKFIDWSFNRDPHSAVAIAENLKSALYRERPMQKGGLHYTKEFYEKVKERKWVSPFTLTDDKGNYKLLVNGESFYVKGIAYNPQHDWRDGHLPLTRKQLEKDFTLIKKMGANTIRRYNPGPYDDNILNIAAEKDMKVMYGFWFDPKTDYFRDTNEVKVEIERVLRTVEKYKNHPAILAWNVGNETWGLLKHQFYKPYLTTVRQEYIKMLEYLAQRIHEIDPAHPVMTSFEHEEFQIRGEFASFRDLAPSLDIIGVNSYYDEQIKELANIATQMEPDRPYMVTEFGPRGYWEPKYSKSRKGRVLEDSDEEKSEFYAMQWKRYIEKNAGKNVGGVAYCWKDRLEGSLTWFGLSDNEGNVKPAYYSLKECWEGTSTPYVLKTANICSPDGQFKPGTEYKFCAQVPGVTREGLSYEWALHREEYLEKIDVVKSNLHGDSITLKIPAEPSRYRLYLYVRDNKGNVVTDSYPLMVKNN